MKLSRNAKHAILIGSLCSISYFAVYIARNILGAVTPQMLESGLYSEAYIGTISSVYFFFYAFGQLINGFIGDKIKARNMISCGLLLAGISNFAFSRITDLASIAGFVYGLTGFFLAMIYGPMTKVVAENTEPDHATRCSLGYTVASFLGSPAAGMLASLMAWQTVFAVSSTILVVMAVSAFTLFWMMERRGIVQYGQYQLKKQEGERVSFPDRVRILLRHRIIKFSLISFLTGVVRTSVVFWLPTYFAQALGYSSERSASIFTVTTLIMSLTSFIAVFIFERLHRNMDLTVLLMFSAAALFFAGVYVIKQPIVNIVMIVLAIMASNGAATMLWSRYCPSLRDTGMVSGATGFLDFVSYMAAALANIVFANAVTAIGWSNLILVWFVLMVFGVIVALPYHKWKRKKTTV